MGDRHTFNFISHIVDSDREVAEGIVDEHILKHILKSKRSKINNDLFELFGA